MSDHTPGPGKMVSARDEAVERALMAAWCNPPTSSGMTDAEAFISALADAGYAVVPVAPTEAMLDAGEECIVRNEDCLLPEDVYFAMLVAAKKTQA